MSNINVKNTSGKTLYDTLIYLFSSPKDLTAIFEILFILLLIILFPVILIHINTAAGGTVKFGFIQYTKDNKEYIKKIDNLTKENGNLTQQIKSLKEKHQELEKKYNRIRRYAKEELFTLKERIYELKNKNENLNFQNYSLNSQNENLNFQNYALNSKNDNLINKTIELSKEKYINEDYIDRLEKENEEQENFHFIDSSDNSIFGRSPIPINYNSTTPQPFFNPRDIMEANMKANKEAAAKKMKEQLKKR